MQDPCVRGLAVAPQSYYGSQIYYQISTGGTADGILQPTSDVDQWPLCAGTQERLWQVRSRVLEVVTIEAVPIRPLGQSQILRLGRPRSHMHLRVTASHSQGNDSYLIDLGQTWEVYAQKVTIEVLSTIGAAKVIDGQGPALSGIVANAMIHGAVEQIEESRGGSNVALLTQTWWSRGGDQLVGLVPAGARELTIIPDDPAGSVDFQWWRGSPTGPEGFEMGTTRLPASWQPPSSVAPSASHWAIVPEAVERTITLVWKVQA